VTTTTTPPRPPVTIPLTTLEARGEAAREIVNVALRAREFEAAYEAAMAVLRRVATEARNGA
jgi:hypothetical protein